MLVRSGRDPDRGDLPPRSDVGYDGPGLLRGAGVKRDRLPHRLRPTLDRFEARSLLAIGPLPGAAIPEPPSPPAPSLTAEASTESAAHDRKEAPPDVDQVASDTPDVVLRQSLFQLPSPPGAVESDNVLRDIGNQPGRGGDPRGDRQGLPGLPPGNLPGNLGPRPPTDPQDPLSADSRQHGIRRGAAGAPALAALPARMGSSGVNQATTERPRRSSTASSVTRLSALGGAFDLDSILGLLDFDALLEEDAEDLRDANVFTLSTSLGIEPLARRAGDETIEEDTSLVSLSGTERMAMVTILVPRTVRASNASGPWGGAGSPTGEARVSAIAKANRFAYGLDEPVDRAILQMGATDCSQPPDRFAAAGPGPSGPSYGGTGTGFESIGPRGAPEPRPGSRAPNPARSTGAGAEQVPGATDGPTSPAEDPGPGSAGDECGASPTRRSALLGLAAAGLAARITRGVGRGNSSRRKSAGVCPAPQPLRTPRRRPWKPE